MGIPVPPEGNIEWRKGQYVWVKYKAKGIVEHSLDEKGFTSLVKYFFREVFPRPYPETRNVKLHRPPGAHLFRIVDFLCSPTTVERVFMQLIADWRLEYFQAIAARRTLKAKWISVRYHWAFAKALGLQRLFSFLSKLLSAARTSE